MSKRSCGHFVHIIYEDGKRCVIDEDDFDSISISRTASSDVVKVIYTQPIGSCLSFEVHLDDKEHIEISGV